MKTQILSIAALFLSVNVMASEAFRCTASLISPMLEDGRGLWMAPESRLVNFSYDPFTEKTVKVAIKLVVAPDNPGSGEYLGQYGVIEAGPGDDVALSIEFSKTSPDGNLFSGDGFGVYLRAPTDGANPLWSMALHDEVKLVRPIPITQKLNGYAVLTCMKDRH